MNESYDLQKESFEFAQKIIEFYKKLVFDFKEFVISKRILKSATGIGLEILKSEKKTAFDYAVETDFWLQLLKKEYFFESEEIEKLIKENRELINHLEISIKKVLIKEY